MAPAHGGLRTNALVAIGAAMFVMLAMPTADNTMRVAAQVVSGIGFLGAGVIMREGLTVRGLNGCDPVVLGCRRYAERLRANPPGGGRDFRCAAGELRLAPAGAADRSPTD